jgi:hypothetical protein
MRPVIDPRRFAPWQRDILAKFGRPQHRALLAYLFQHGRTSCSALERVCGVRSVTSRMSEIDDRVTIERSRGHEPDEFGEPRPATFYEVAKPLPQLRLPFDDEGDSE